MNASTRRHLRRRRPHRRPSPRLHLVLVAAATVAIPPSARSRAAAESSLSSSLPLARTGDRRDEDSDHDTVCDDPSRSIAGPLRESDVDRSGRLDGEEYVRFADALSGGYLTRRGWTDGGFADLPLGLREEYLVLSCLCELYPDEEAQWGGRGCCERDNGDPDGTGTGIRVDDRAGYLKYACESMTGALETQGAPTIALRAVPPPTRSPASANPAPTSETADNAPESYYESYWADLPPDVRDAFAALGYDETMWDGAIPPESANKYWDCLSPLEQEAAMSLGMTQGTWDATYAPTSSAASGEPAAQLASGPSRRPAPSSAPAVVVPSSPGGSSASTSLSSSIAPVTIPFLPFTGDVTAGVEFIVVLDGRLDAFEIMVGDATDGVKVVMEEHLLTLSEIVVEEEFGGGGDDAALGAETSTASARKPSTKLRDDEPTVRRRARERISAVSATVDLVEEVVCPDGLPTRAIQCLKFSNSILLHMADEPNVDDKIKIFEDAMLTAIADGWLVENLDLLGAAEPPLPPNESDSGEAGVEREQKTKESRSLSPGAIAAVILMALSCLIMAVIFVLSVKRNRKPGNVSRSARAEKRKKRNRRMKFASYLLFVIGSVLYLVMAVQDFRYARELQNLPMWLRMADDDVAWTNYRLGERAAAANAGGARRTKTRERQAEEEGRALEARAAKQKAAEGVESLIRVKPVAKSAESTGRGLQTPKELYYDSYWADLPLQIQDAYAVLGLNETMWNQAIKPESAESSWSALSPQMQEAALFIGYTQKTWDITLAPTSSPSTTLAQNTPPPPSPTLPYVLSVPAEGLQSEAGPEPMLTSSSNTTALPDNNSSATGATTNASDITNAPENKTEIEEGIHVEAGYYDDFGWAELPPHIQEAAATLGYDQNTWDLGDMGWSDNLFWDELPSEAQDAAAQLGYDKSSWDGSEGSSDDYVSYDDDYVFEVGSSGVWVSEYQILYFTAALCFFVVGILDLFRERHVFHILMISAGAFGLMSAVYIEEDIHLSNIFNAVSVHLYLLEAISLFGQFGDHKRGAITVEDGIWMTWFIKFGDLSFVLGSFMDVIGSYFYLFDDTADWDKSLMAASIVAALFWLLCSFVYVGSFCYEYHADKNFECHRQEESERASLARLEEAANEDSNWASEGSNISDLPREIFQENGKESVKLPKEARTHLIETGVA